MHNDSVLKVSENALISKPLMTSKIPGYRFFCFSKIPWFKFSNCFKPKQNYQQPLAYNDRNSTRKFICNFMSSLL